MIDTPGCRVPAYRRKSIVLQLLAIKRDRGAVRLLRGRSSMYRISSHLGYAPAGDCSTGRPPWVGGPPRTPESGFAPTAERSGSDLVCRRVRGNQHLATAWCLASWADHELTLSVTSLHSCDKTLRRPSFHIPPLSGRVRRSPSSPINLLLSRQPIENLGEVCARLENSVRHQSAIPLTNPRGYRQFSR